MKLSGDHGHLIHLLANLQEVEVLNEVHRLLARGESPLAILQSCQQGMRYVGENYEQGQYFISGLIMAGEILRQVAELLQPVIESQIQGDASGRIIMGTVQGDIHDIGKNLVITLLRCHGFEVLDLGVDVAPAKFLDAARSFGPGIVGLSALLTVAYESMRDTITLLKSLKTPDSPRPWIVIGGGLIDEKICRFVQADYWAAEAVPGVALCRQLMDDLDLRS